MTRTDAILVHVAVALTAITGIVFAWMKYAMTTDDPFAVANHPLQPSFLDAHVLSAPLAMFVFGLIFRSHIWKKYKGGRPQRRRSGVSSMFLIVPMVLSGYLLQVSAGEAMREAMAVLHWISSGLFVVTYLGHQVARRDSRDAAGSG